MIDFTCPNCDTELSFGDEFIGVVVNCYDCGQAATVPEPGEPAEMVHDRQTYLRTTIGRPSIGLPMMLWVIGGVLCLGGAVILVGGLFEEELALMATGVGTMAGAIVWFWLGSALWEFRQFRREFNRFAAGQRRSSRGR